MGQIRAGMHPCSLPQEHTRLPCRGYSTCGRRLPPAFAIGQGHRWVYAQPSHAAALSCRIPRRSMRAAATSEQRGSSYLSDMLVFESDKEDSEAGPSSPEAEEDTVERAMAALAVARQALESTRSRMPSRPVGNFQYSNTRSDLREGLASPSTSQSSFGEDEQSQAATRASLEDALSSYAAGSSGDSLDLYDSPSTPSESSAAMSPTEGESAPPSWTSLYARSSTAPAEPELQPQLHPQGQPAAKRTTMFAERPVWASLDLISQMEADAEWAKGATLPPLQSVLELTTATQPPSRNADPESLAQPMSVAGRMMEDGQGQLADGTRYERESGEEFGKDGYWLRWTVLRGVSMAGKVEWEERWWEASDWAGMREMGAEKSGCKTDGSAWRETWREAIAFQPGSDEPMVERTAHKWARDPQGDEWEEKWGEHYLHNGQANKYADKWGKEGGNVWHERWGEDYDGQDGCVKYTDKWAERLVGPEATEQWGEKWTETFKHGAGNKTGETWSVAAGGERYQRWWGENHFGNGWVQRYGNSTTGEQWDHSEQMDTYYNPIPHFTYRMALDHSPTLRNVPTLPRGGDELGAGLDSL